MRMFKSRAAQTGDASLTSNMAVCKGSEGVDLLKTAAMLAIVAWHIICWGGWGLGCGEGMKGLVIEVFSAVLLCHVNCFVLASGWIMVKKDFKFGRIVKLWKQAFFYSALFVVVALVFFPNVLTSVRAGILYLVPLMTDRYWFFTQYTGLFFLMPILNAAIMGIEKRQMVVLLISLFVIFSVLPLVSARDLFKLHNGYSTFWFAYLYMVGGFLSFHADGLRGFIRGRFAVMLVPLCVAGSIVGTRVWPFFRPNMEAESVARAFRAYNSPMVFLQAVLVLLMFTKIVVASECMKRLLKTIRPSIFAVYLIHSNPLFREITDWNRNWTEILGAASLGRSLVLICGGAISIFVFCQVFDLAVRRVVLCKAFNWCASNIRNLKTSMSRNRWQNKP